MQEGYEAPDLVSGLEHVAKFRRITHLVIGHRPRVGFDRWLKAPLSDALGDRLPSLELHLVTEADPSEPS